MGQASGNGTEHPCAAVRFKVRCSALTRPSADIVATAADDPKPTTATSGPTSRRWQALAQQKAEHPAIAGKPARLR